MKTVTLNAFVMIPAGQGQPAFDFGYGVVKSRIETGDMRCFGIEFARFFYEMKRCWLMQRGKRYKFFQCGQHIVSDRHRVSKNSSAMHHAVAD